MRPCPCTERHARHRVVLTGGPGAGKTAVLEVLRHTFCNHVVLLPEAASIVFGGGFPRGPTGELLRAAQRAIFYVQRELEDAAEAGSPAMVVCDRGTLDGCAYWPGPGDLPSSVGASHEELLARYDAVIHMRTPAADAGYNHHNPLRIESPAEAAAIDERIALAWKRHPRVFVIDAHPGFMHKAARALSLLRAEMPACCRSHVLPLLEDLGR